VLAAAGDSPYHADRLSYTAAHDLVEEAKRLADFVVIDTPPLTAVIDALPFAQVVDEVVVSVRVGHTRLSKLAALWELLDQQATPPRGFVLIGVQRNTDDGYGYYARPAPPDRQVADGVSELLKSRPTPRA
jgi:polysaccharide biosynthesis transport protein